MNDVVRTETCGHKNLTKIQQMTKVFLSFIFVYFFKLFPPVCVCVRIFLNTFFFLTVHPHSFCGYL